MKKYYVSIIAFVVAIMFVLSVCLSATIDGSSLDNTIVMSEYAKENDFLRSNLDEIIGHIISGGKKFSALINKLPTSIVKKGFKIFNLDDTSKNASNAVHFPILSEGHIIAILSVHNNEGSYVCTVNESFGKTIDSLTDKNIMLLSKGSNLYAYDGNNFFGVVISDENIEITKNDLKSIESIIAEKKDYVYNVEKASLEQNNMAFFNDYLAKPSTAYINSSTQLSDFPCIGQQYNGSAYYICYAACIAAMYNYMQGTNYMATDIIDNYPYRNEHIVDLSGNPNPQDWYYYNQAATFANIRSYIFPYYFPNALPYLNGVTQNLITTNINNDVPLYISTEAESATDYNDNLYHAVSVYGYNNSSSTYSAYIMDPWCDSDGDGKAGDGGFVIAVYQNGSSPASYSMGGTGTTMYFRRALVPNEN